MKKHNSILEKDKKFLNSENEKYIDLLAKATEENKENVILIQLLKQNIEWMKVHADGINSIVYNCIDEITTSEN